ncbi:MAG: diadenylate cyclase CdaA [Lachnospiraceae bacterium]|nr:diadenylate cyclase CdaA [Lachnospiraceae bacterium]MDD3660276.1 diadenylate cyclase CdaA [Lachnospiraceae bacterium]
MEQIFEFINKYMLTLHMPSIRWEDVAEIIIISFLVYQIMLWIKNTRAWSLLKGVVVIMVFILIAAIFRMTTILWIVENVLGLAVIAIIVVLQPELRRALELLGQKNILSSILPFDTGKNITGRFTDRTVNEIVKACFEMGRVKTGALIVVEQNVTLAEYERTGIPVDAILSSQLLINIFEHNTPLHDGAVIVRENRIVSATCYLPLSDNMELSKELGTRHRAAVGISEATDSLTIIVSEETGKISIAYGGQLHRNINADTLKERLSELQNKSGDEKKHKLWKGRSKNEKEIDK